MQDHPWLQAYIQLALRMEKYFRKHFQFPFVGYYYGPSEWKTQVEAEEIQDPATFLQAINKLQDALTDQGFEQHREVYLSKQLIATELVCRQLSGERFTLDEELRRLYDITLTWTPDEHFDAALTLLDEALPGTTSPGERMADWRLHHAFPKEKRHEASRVITLWLEEIQRCSVKLFSLPPEEEILFEMEPMNGGPSGVCLYQGHYRSRCVLDVADYIEMQDALSTLVEDLCHETYPGHHASFVSRERHLYRNQGYLEESIWLMHSPNAIIGEGIATHACSMLFTPEELQTWLEEKVYPILGIRPDGSDLGKIQRAHDMLNDLYGNALLLWDEGCPEDEIQAYLGKYLRDAPFWLWKLPFRKFVIFYEKYAKRLMQPWLQGNDRHQMFRRLLEEQFYPSELIKP